MRHTNLMTLRFKAAFVFPLLLTNDPSAIADSGARQRGNREWTEFIPLLDSFHQCLYTSDPVYKKDIQFLFFFFLLPLLSVRPIHQTFQISFCPQPVRRAKLIVQIQHIFLLFA